MGRQGDIPGGTVTNPIDGQPVVPMRAVEGATRELFEADILPGGEPVILKGVADHWPAVDIGRAGDAQAMVDYLLSLDSGAPMNAMMGDPKAGGRFIYNAGMTGYNFRREKAPARVVLPAMLRFADDGETPYLYAGATSTHDVFPRLGETNHLDLVPEGTQPLAWIGNPSRIAPHYDISENIAVCVMGRRQFMLYPPEQVENLYIGPWENTPAGPECSIVDIRDPDLERFPRYAEARRHARLADLSPGDAIYIPPLWWHTVEARGDFNVLVNFWWPTKGANGTSMAALAHALLTIRDLPPHQREAWKAYFDFYVFSDDAPKAADHIPPHAQGVRGPASAQRDEIIRNFIRSML